jgi:hypothetical protein
MYVAGGNICLRMAKISPPFFFLLGSACMCPSFVSVFIHESPIFILWARQAVIDGGTYHSAGVS